MKKDLLGARDQAPPSEILSREMQPDKKGAMRGQHLIVELAKLRPIQESATTHLSATDLAVNTRIDLVVLVTTFPETYDISLHSNIHRLT